MPTELGKPFSIDWRGNPPHMLEPDIPIWYRFLNSYGHLFKKLYYDAYVGGVFASPQKLLDPFQKMWRAVNAKRIDALVETEESVWIIEVSLVPGLRAIGQLEVYRYLWLEDPNILKPVSLILVCQMIDEDVIAAGSSLGIATYVMPE